MVKYGYLGFCLLLHKSVENVICNIVLCSGCSHFRSNELLRDVKS